MKGDAIRQISNKSKSFIIFVILWITHLTNFLVSKFILITFFLDFSKFLV